MIRSGGSMISYFFTGPIFVTSLDDNMSFAAIIYSGAYLFEIIGGVSVFWDSQQCHISRN